MVTVQRINVNEVINGLVFPFRRIISCFSMAGRAKIANSLVSPSVRGDFYGCGSPKNTKFFRVTANKTIYYAE